MQRLAILQVSLYGLRPRLEKEVRLSAELAEDISEIKNEAKARCNVLSRKMERRFDDNKNAPLKYEIEYLVPVERTLLIPGLRSGKLVPKYMNPVKIMEVLKNDRYRVILLTADKPRFNSVSQR